MRADQDATIQGNSHFCKFLSAIDEVDAESTIDRVHHEHEHAVVKSMTRCCAYTTGRFAIDFVARS